MQKKSKQSVSVETEKPIYYVGIGASAGGLEALDIFFTNMPPDSNLAFIVIQHLSPDYKSMMVELLSKRTSMRVIRAEEGMEVVRNSVYLIPPRKLLTIFHGKLILTDIDHSRGINLPIDVFFRSLAEDQADRAIGIILSGTGSDGVRGIRAIKETGGLLLVQNEQSAKFDGMPRSAAATGLADVILAVDEMPERLLGFIKRPLSTPVDHPKALMSDEDGLTRVFAMLRDQTKVDFTYYKPSTVLRRLERRMTVNQVDHLREYVRLLESRPAEVTTLYRELLIGVTSFFRDREVFDELVDTHLPYLLTHSDNREIRIWVAGCSTGEEAYTLAILVNEIMERNQLNLNVKIFATDIDRDAIVHAGNGIYSESITADLPLGIISKYFRRVDEHYHIQRNIREMVVFAQHNLIKDPPFTSIDLVSCRNLLIYLQPILQRKVMEYFNFSLVPQGILLLGSSETPGEMGDYFEPVHQKYKIFRSRGRKRLPSESSLFAANEGAQTTWRPIRHRATTVLNVREEERILDRLLQSLSGDYITVIAIVNEQLEILHLVGEADSYFKLQVGRQSNDITRMAVKELAIPISTGLQKVFQTGKEVKYSKIRLPVMNSIKNIELRIKLLPGKKNQDRLAALFIQELATKSIPSSTIEAEVYDLSFEAEQRIQDLEQELQFTKENLQATIEELETSNEELQATNEELLASNEELQSTNEELQSVNEELHTVNAEYQSKILELTEMTNDLDNLFAATQKAILFLDENLDIRKYTSEVTRLFRIVSSDIGRPLGHLAHMLKDTNPFELINKVVASNELIEREVSTIDDRWYLMRILPYDIGTSKASGIVLTFTDIQPFKESEQLLEKERSQLLSIFDSFDEIIYVADMDTYEIIYANRATEAIFGTGLVGSICYKSLQNSDSPCEFCTNSIIKNMQYEPYRWDYHNPHVVKDYQIMDRVVKWSDGRDVRLEVAFDITKRKQIEQELDRLWSTIKQSKESVD